MPDHHAGQIDAHRRRMLTAGTSLAVLGAVGLGSVVRQAQAQTAPTAAAGKSPIAATAAAPSNGPGRV